LPPRTDFVTGSFELATYRFRSDSELAGSLSVQLFCDGQVLGLLIFANRLPCARTQNTIDVSMIETFVGQALLHLIDIIVASVG
jgi:hypothetical protein